MELNIGKQSVVINEIAYEGTLEQPIESDVLLPDYCPDIVKILRCFCVPRVTSAQAGGGKLTVDLSCACKVFYLGADQNIRCLEQRMPYTKSVDIGVQAGDPIVDASCRTDYVNCRAVNQRRLEIRCAVSIECRVFSRQSQDLVCDASGCGIQLKTAACDVTEISSDTARQWSMHEDLQLASQKPAIQSVIREECCCRISDYKVISGKVVIKGELALHILYQPETGDSRPETMEYALPISQIVDVEGIDEGYTCDVSLFPVSCEFAPKVNLEGESRLIAMDCTLGARVRAHRRQKLGLITDCYSTDYECRMERVPLSCLDLIRVVEDKCIHKCTLPLPENASAVLDLFCIVADISTRSENGAAIALFKLLYCMFTCDEQGDILYSEQPEECEYRIPAEGDAGSFLFLPRGTVLSTSFSMSGASSVDCRCEIAVGGCLYSVMRPKVAVSISCDTAKQKERCRDASLVIYYAANGEDVWEIAKRYNTSLQAVMDENALTETTLQDKRMLLIPIV
ncbi:MAG: DUF3794 domain-containing protein [Provencibacterium sp.]|jgi:hypothetical protein|nr:DUF3794 domain-containing protein [Provencibacterium sp.]